MFVLKLSMGIGMTLYPGIGVSKKRKQSSGILLVSVLAFFWYQNKYQYRTLPSNDMIVRKSIVICILVTVEQYLNEAIRENCKTLDIIQKTLKTSTGCITHSRPCP